MRAFLLLVALLIGLASPARAADDVAAAQGVIRSQEQAFSRDDAAAAYSHAAPAIQEKLFKPTGWHYSTVRTMMDRMVVKGVLKAKKQGKLTIYQSAVTRAQAQSGELFYALKHAFNGALTPMIQCLLDVEEVSDEEIARIEALIQQKNNKRK